MPWVDDPTLATGENITWQRNANREQSPLRYVGGKLFVTDRRIIFVANRFDKSTGGDSWVRPLRDVTSVLIEPAHAAIPFLGLTARMRRRLRLEGRDGEIALFVVNRVDESARMIQAAVASAVTE